MEKNWKNGWYFWIYKSGSNSKNKRKKSKLNPCQDITSSKTKEEISDAKDLRKGKVDPVMAKKIMWEIKVLRETHIDSKGMIDFKKSKLDHY